MVKVKCGWGDCLKEYEFSVTVLKGGGILRSQNPCPHCGRLNKSSHRDSVEHSARKHMHRELKDGDVV